MRPSLINRHGEIGNAINRSLVNSIVFSQKIINCDTPFFSLEDFVVLKTVLIHFRAFVTHFRIFWPIFDQVCYTFGLHCFNFKHFGTHLQIFRSIFETFRTFLIGFRKCLIHLWTFLIHLRPFWFIFKHFCFYFWSIFDSILNMLTLWLFKIEYFWWKLIKIFMNILRCDF